MEAGHSIEFGEATWDPTAQSVRNRYDNPDGRFSPRGSSEIPLGDLVPILVETARRDLLDARSAAEIISALSRSIERQVQNPPAGEADATTASEPDTQAFHAAMLDVYKRAKSECNYNASRFLQMVADHGGVETARMLLHSSTVSDGYTALWERGRLDLTVEHLVIQPEWAPLFTDDERATARSRLKQYGFEGV